MYPRTLADFTGPCRGSGEELNYQCCPVCNSAGWKVYVNTITGKWFCFASAHGSGGKVAAENWSDQAKAELLEMLRPALYGVPHTNTWPEVALPDWRPLGVVAQNYLARRGIQRTTCGTLGVVEMCVSPRILIPYHGPYGRIIHWTGRAFGSELDGVPKYMSASGAKPLFMLPRWEAVSCAVVVEGVFDAIAVWQATGLPAVAIGGKVLSERIERDLRSLVRQDVWLMLDGDAQAQLLDLKERLMDRYQCKLVRLEGRQDPGSISPEEIRSLLLGA